jgi:hypothetical protein
MNYSISTKTVDYYSEMLVNKKTDCIYTIKAIGNALKIQIAYRVYKIKSEQDLEMGKKYVAAADLAYACYPHDTSHALNLENPAEALESINSFSEYLKMESLESFFQFCLSTKENNENYWKEIFAHLNISLDENDKSDPIYLLMKTSPQTFTNETSHKTIWSKLFSSFKSRQ